ncbi:hypothetical protein MUU72_26890 [Streptomyces sp. RS10V-4]|uniref:hypothetical protein n=1 Tax=Streptomyces rhizoryzae TaxID=2932493 RepID=UPI0020030911|nr:hypothetical protein [Streptomyces rhizoryzae]MCK7626687.1 hypothetical protein [Streptomyces rhizoryzae]
MHRLRRSATLTLLLLLAVAFGPLLCRTGGPQDRPAARAAVAAAATAEGRHTAPERAPYPAAERAGAAPVAVADSLKRCSGRHAPDPGEAAPLPAPPRGEPLAPDPTAAGPLAAALPPRCALARPPTGAPAADPAALLPVLRI